MKSGSDPNLTGPSRARPALPRAPTNLVGREREIAEVVWVLPSARLVSLTGPGGCGKTRLALAVAAQMESEFAEGVYWVDLVRASEPDFVPQVVAGALGIAEQPGSPLLETILERLEGKRMLLVLDNCEHVLAASADLVEALAAVSSVAILTTSREPLGVEGEVRYPVSPLSLPAPGQTYEEVAGSEAVRLFAEHACLVRPDFALTPENTVMIAEICRRLDGLPLAIELASARVNVLSLAQIAAHLEQRLDLLVSVTRGSTRHQTLRASLDWSYQLLAPPERLLLHRLSLFASGFSLETCEAICAWGKLEAVPVLELLTSLVNKSLVVADNLDAGEARYRLLETIRQFAAEKLEASDEWHQTHDRSLGSFLKLAEAITPKLNEPDQQHWHDWLERELDNIRMALDWAWQQHHHEAGLRMVIALYFFWDMRGRAHEGCTWFERLLKMPAETAEKLPLELRVNALTYASFLAMFIFDVPRSTAWAEEAVRLCEAAGEAGQPLLWFALAGLDSAFRMSGDWQASLGILERSLELLRPSGDAEGLYLGMALYSCGMTQAALGHHQAARRNLDEALALSEQAGDTYRRAATVNALGDLARFEGRFAAALPYYRESRSLFRQAGAHRLLPTAERNFAYACLRVGDTALAHTLLRESFEKQLERDDRVGILRGLLGFAALAAAVGLWEASARLHGFVRAYHKTPMFYLESGDKADEVDDAHFAALVRANLSELELETAMEKGRQMRLEEAVAYALGLDVQVVTPRSHDLTRRERDLAGLIGAGLSNGDIADRLGLSKRTVEKHVANILLKLEFKNRAQIVRWAVDHGLANEPDTPT